VPYPDAPEVQTYVMLVFETDDRQGVTKLAVKGPKLPGVGASPTIAFHRKGDRYVFEIGGGETTFAPGELSAELKKFLGGSDSGGKTAPVPLRMPGQDQLKHTSDGSYKSFDDYERDVRMRAISAANNEKVYAARWPKLPKPLYDALIRHYRIKDLTADGNPLYL